jgi:type VI protein secretion system component VasF
MPDKPLPKWRADIRRKLADRGYAPDWDELDRKRKRLALRLFIMGLTLGAIAVALLVVIKAFGWV